MSRWEPYIIIPTITQKQLTKDFTDFKMSLHPHSYNDHWPPRDPWDRTYRGSLAEICIANDLGVEPIWNWDGKPRRGPDLVAANGIGIDVTSVTDPHRDLKFPNEARLRGELIVVCLIPEGNEQIVTLGWITKENALRRKQRFTVYGQHWLVLNQHLEGDYREIRG